MATLFSVVQFELMIYELNTGNIPCISATTAFMEELLESERNTDAPRTYPVNSIPYIINDEQEEPYNIIDWEDVENKVDSNNEVKL